MTVGAGDALFGRDGTGPGELGPDTAAVREPVRSVARPPHLGAPAIGRPQPVAARRRTPAPARPRAVAGARPGTPRPVVAPRPEARPRIVEEPGILGLSRRARGRVGSRLFNLFFVFVFGLILIQMVVALLLP